MPPLVLWLMYMHRPVNTYFLSVTHNCASLTWNCAFLFWLSVVHFLPFPAPSLTFFAFRSWFLFSFNLPASFSLPSFETSTPLPETSSTYHLSDSVGNSSILAGASPSPVFSPWQSQNQSKTSFDCR